MTFRAKNPLDHVVDFILPHPKTVSFHLPET